jgi:hypothetical protein
MEEIGLATFSDLGGVHGPAHGESAVQQGHVPVRVVLEEGSLHPFECSLQGEAGRIATR